MISRPYPRPEDQRDRHRAVARTLFESVDDVEERPDGYAFLLPATTETIARAGQFISRERLCCPFFRLDWRWNRSTAPPG